MTRTGARMSTSRESTSASAAGPPVDAAIATTRLPLLRPAAQAHNALHRFSYSFPLVETVVRHFTVR